MLENSLSGKHIEWLSVPTLKAPYMIMGFQGWSNAGSVSTDTLQFFRDAFQPKICAYVDEEHYQNLTTERPNADIENGLIRSIDSSRSEICFWQNSEGEHDLIFLSAKEPSFLWSEYSNALLHFASKMGVLRVYTIGGVQDAISHSHQPLVTVVASTPELVNEVVSLGGNIRPARYHGPISIHSQIIMMAASLGISGISLWAHVPAYLQRSPRAVARLVAILNKATETFCSTEELLMRAIELDKKIGEALSRDPDLREFIETIEGRRSTDTPKKRSDKVISLNDFIKRDSQKNPES